MLLGRLADRMGTARSVEDILKCLAEATAGLITDASGLADGDVREPSLLPGWTLGPACWPAAFVRENLGRVVQALNDRSLAPLTARLDAVDTDRSFRIVGGGADAARISGTEAELLAWLLGRSDGTGLTKDSPVPLPHVPSIYFT